jgi:8-amino-7-oxononanoate synthase
MIDFCSNDYLGLGKRVFERPKTMARGTCAARLIFGETPLVSEVERDIARFHGVDRCLIFSSGYLANLSTLSALLTRSCTVIHDELIHASLRDGITLSRARCHSFFHNNLEDLKKKLTHARGPSLIVVESLYSMDGDRAPLRAIQEIAFQYGAELFVDEAHSVGIDGRAGRGLADAEAVSHRCIARTVTFGKALGYHGAAVLGDNKVIQTIVNRGRGFIYTTALPDSSLLEIRESYRRISEADEERTSLFQNIALLKTLCGDRLIGEATSPIQYLEINGNAAVTAAANKLAEHGFAMVAIRAPTVPAGKERLRICMHSFNSATEIENLAIVIKRITSRPS